MSDTVGYNDCSGVVNCRGNRPYLRNLTLKKVSNEPWVSDHILKNKVVCKDFEELDSLEIGNYLEFEGENAVKEEEFKKEIKNYFKNPT